MTDSGRPSVPRSSTRSGGGLPVFLQSWIDSALDLIFPPHCVHCKRAGSLLCADCQTQITPAAQLTSIAPLAGQCATASFEGPIRSAIHAFKYENNRRMADLLAARLTSALSATGWQPTLITAVPLHIDRLRERGYNQSALLAERVARHANIPFRGDVIIRIRSTRPQVGLDYHDRQRNVADAFSAVAERVASQSILLIDDVYTTGATLRSCATALLGCGARQVWALTLASAVHKDRESML